MPPPPSPSRHLGRVLSALGLGLIGFAASLAAIYATPIAGVTDLGCGLRGMDCGAVLGSAYSRIGGIPLGVAGGFYFAWWMLFLSAWQRSPREGYRWTLTVTLAAGVVFSLALLGVLALVIRASCVYCLITHAANLGAAALLWPLRLWQIDGAMIRKSWRGLLAIGMIAGLIGIGLYQLYDLRVIRAEAVSKEKTIW